LNAKIRIYTSKYLISKNVDGKKKLLLLWLNMQNQSINYTIYQSFNQSANQSM